MKLLLDMNLSPKLSVLLMNHGIESAHWHDIGAPNARDEEIMIYARENEFIVVTYDLDFSAILSATHGRKPSIIQLRSIPSEQAVNVLAFVLSQYANELEEGAVMTIDLKRARMRLLPLLDKS